MDLSVDEAIRCGACDTVTPFRGAIRTGPGVRGTEFGCSSGHSTQLASSAKRAPIRFRMYAKSMRTGTTNGFTSEPTAPTLMPTPKPARGCASSAHR